MGLRDGSFQFNDGLSGRQMLAPLLVTQPMGQVTMVQLNRPMEYPACLCQLMYSKIFGRTGGNVDSYTNKLG